MGVWDYVNRFRKQVLGLPPLPLGTLSEFFLLDKLAVPTTYAFSPDLVPKPRQVRRDVKRCRPLASASTNGFRRCSDRRREGIHHSPACTFARAQDLFA
jgi:hypothetical protein